MPKGIPQKPIFGTRLVLSESFFSTTSSPVNDARWEYIRTNAAFTASMISTECIQFTISAAQSAGGYADMFRLRTRRPTSFPLDNVELLCLFTSIAGGGTEQFMEIGCRGSGDQGARDSTYMFVEASYMGNQIRLWRSTGGSFSNITNASVSWTAADWYMRFVALGNRFLAKAWAAANPEPTAWDIDTTDTTNAGIRGGGTVVFGLNGGNSGTTTWTQDVKEFHVWDIGKPVALLRAM